MHQCKPYVLRTRAQYIHYERRRVNPTDSELKCLYLKIVATKKNPFHALIKFTDKPMS
jgi:hypothetical protein